MHEKKILFKYGYIIWTKIRGSSTCIAKKQISKRKKGSLVILQSELTFLQDPCVCQHQDWQLQRHPQA